MLKMNEKNPYVYYMACCSLVAFVKGCDECFKEATSYCCGNIMMK